MCADLAGLRWWCLHHLFPLATEVPVLLLLQVPSVFVEEAVWGPWMSLSLLSACVLLAGFSVAITVVSLARVSSLLLLEEFALLPLSVISIACSKSAA